MDREKRGKEREVFVPEPKGKPQRKNASFLIDDMWTAEKKKVEEKKKTEENADLTGHTGEKAMKKKKRREEEEEEGEGEGEGGDDC